MQSLMGLRDLSEIDHSGFLNLDKPLHLSSHDVVAHVRRHYRELTGSRKVGHAGTLDPLASGVLVLCLGKATRLSDYVMHTTKVYRAQVTLGQSTTTYDTAGEILERHDDTSGITLSDLQNAVSQFIGDVQQVPPMYSAVKVKGRRLYELARQGKVLERQARAVRIDSINIKNWDNPAVELEVRCGAGTYIRSLAHDIGQLLGVGAHLSGLRRVVSGQFDIGASVAFERVAADDKWLNQIVPPYRALADEPQIEVSADDIMRIQHGRAIACRKPPSAKRVFAFSDDKRLVAILTATDDSWKPYKVFWNQS